MLSFKKEKVKSVYGLVVDHNDGAIECLENEKHKIASKVERLKSETVERPLAWVEDHGLKPMKENEAVPKHAFVLAKAESHMQGIDSEYKSMILPEEVEALKGDLYANHGLHSDGLKIITQGSFDKFLKKSKNLFVFRHVEKYGCTGSRSGGSAAIRNLIYFFWCLLFSASIGFVASYLGLRIVAVLGGAGLFCLFLFFGKFMLADYLKQVGYHGHSIVQSIDRWMEMMIPARWLLLLHFPDRHDYSSSAKESYRYDYKYIYFNGVSEKMAACVKQLAQAGAKYGLILPYQLVRFKQDDSIEQVRMSNVEAPGLFIEYELDDKTIYVFIDTESSEFSSSDLKLVG